MKKRRDLRILFSSNGIHTNSGYAVEQRELLSRLSADGWKIAQVAFWGLRGYPITYTDPPFDKGNPIRVYPQMAEDYGTDAMYHSSKAFGAHVAFCMQDLGLLNSQFLNQMIVDKFPWIPWLPVDQDPVPPAVLEKLRFAYKILTFSKYGQKQLEDAGYTSQMIYEGTNTSLFKPIENYKEGEKIQVPLLHLTGDTPQTYSKTTREQIRAEYGIPQDAFVFTMVAANKENPPRKGYQEALEAFKIFYANHPEAALFIHNQQVAPGNFPLIQFAQHLGIAHRLFGYDQHKAMFASNSWEVMKQMNMADVLLHPSQTEGFGLTIIESQACGKPAIVTDGMSMPELVVSGKTGEIAKVMHRRFSSSGGYWVVADPQDVADKMEKVYQMIKADPKKVAKDCRSNIVKNFNIDTIVKKQWIPALESLQEELLGPIVDKKETPVAK